MSQRVLQFSGAGILKTWFEPQGLQQLLVNSLTNAGWGVTKLELTAWPTYGYHIFIDVNAVPNENPERVKSALIAHVSEYFKNVTFNLIGDNLATLNSSGQINYEPTNAYPQQPSVIDNIQSYLFGNSTTATVATASVGTILLLTGVGLVAIMALRSPTSPVRYFGRG